MSYINIQNVVEVLDIRSEGITCPVMCLLQGGLQAIVKYQHK